MMAAMRIFPSNPTTTKARITDPKALLGTCCVAHLPEKYKALFSFS